MKQHQGFTLIELVIVIIILGILAVTAAPKFINFQGDARVSALKGVEGSLKSANAMVYSKALLVGEEKKATGSVDIGTGTNAATNYGYLQATQTELENATDLKFDAGTSPTATGTNDWIIDATTTTGQAIIWQRGAPAGCSITYTGATATANPVYSSLPSASDC
ncbi:prepilin-type N-terminal cleavage/methylation domain-containing protein [Parashewanella tropica]|uniref:prepilin-type N-terminal cleavage/methylation domain-containing protein n=1 Tax=Parashewanella tropica TaxID=2547970 RepID=UPI00105A25CC|nr:prepilin-type N-terminal cleavage/methylation domain-containing protein [Parashewanella tropica]